MHSNPNNSITPDLTERFTNLVDGRTGLRSGLQVEVSEPADDREPSTLNHQPATIDSQPPSTIDALPVLDFIASDETLDRCDEVISAGGWRLDSYRRNPVFQNAHQYGDIIFTLGKALITEVRYRTPREAPGGLNSPASTPCLFQRVQFATDANPMARIAYALYKGKFLNAVSVGFIPLRWADGEVAEPNPKSAMRIRRRYLEQELLEVSAVGIPANPNALQLGLKAGAIQKADLSDLLELLQTVLNSTVNGRRSEPDAPRLLALARDVWQVLKRS